MVMTMNCHKSQQKIDLFVLEGLGSQEEAELQAHLAHCPQCRATEAECRELVGIFKQDSNSPETLALEKKISAAAAVEIDSQRQRLRIRQTVTTGGALAAMLLLGLGLWIIIQAGRKEPSDEVSPKQLVTTNISLEEKWQYTGAISQAASMADSIVVQKSVMYLIENDRGRGRVVSVDTATGESRWKSTVGSIGYLAADELRVFCLEKGLGGSIDLLALDAENGRELWRSTYKGKSFNPCPSRPLPMGDGKISWTIGGEVRMIDSVTGKELWVRSFTGQDFPSRAAVMNDEIYVVTTRALMCLKQETGETLWSKPCDRSYAVRGRPLLTLSDGKIYFAQMAKGNKSDLFCVDITSRNLLWKKDISRIRYLLSTSQGLFMRSESIIALSRESGKELWSQPAEGCGPLNAIDGMIHFVDTEDNGKAVAIEQNTGHIVCEIPGIFSCDAFTRFGDIGYIKTQDGVVHAIILPESGQS